MCSQAVHFSFALFFQNINKSELDHQQDSTKCSTLHSVMVFETVSFSAASAIWVFFKRSHYALGKERWEEAEDRTISVASFRLGKWTAKREEATPHCVHAYAFFNKCYPITPKECSVPPTLWVPFSGSPQVNNEFKKFLKYWQFDQWKKCYHIEFPFP